MSSADKAALRRLARVARRVLQVAGPEAGEQAARHFAAADPGSFQVAALYWPCGSELDPRPLGRALEARGTRLCLPTVAAADCALEFRAFHEGDALATDALGLAAPGADAEVLRPDLVIVPLLAFDASGGRLGQGGGYYDRTLEQLRAEGPVFVVGLAYAGQEVDRLPAEDHDQPLDAVLTEAGLRRFATEDG